MILPDQLTLEQPSHPEADQRLVEIQAQLEKLERRDWWLWGLAVIVMLLLTFTVFSMSFPELIKVDDPFFQSGLDRAVRGLAGLVLIFNGYTIYQQVMIKRLRRQFSEKLAEMRVLQVRALEFHRLAIIDPLTGLYNRRVAEERIAAEASRSQRYGDALTVVALDLNDFKRINDTHGHPAGDQVLKEFAKRLSSAIRLSDFAARMGGDEFLVLLPECPATQVDAFLKRLQNLVVDYGGQKIPVLFSAGWVGYEVGESTADFLERADRTLYAEKRATKARGEREVPLLETR
jgi:diguanylate cyclase (GGDEF)-like protein